MRRIGTVVVSVSLLALALIGAARAEAAVDVQLLDGLLVVGGSNPNDRNKFVIEPDTYCMMLLAQPADGLIGAGIITQVVRDRYALCVVRPDGEGGCSEFPLSQPDEDNWRLSVLACPVGSAGRYYVGWSFDYTLEGGVNSFLEPGALSLELDVAGPNVDCVAEPPVA